jgi:hypothetical protein
VVRGARNSGIEAMPSILKQNDRSFARMYKGGRTMVTEYGPKEMVIEDSGNPLLSVRPFRSGYLGVGLARTQGTPVWPTWLVASTRSRGSSRTVSIWCVDLRFR